MYEYKAEQIAEFTSWYFEGHLPDHIFRYDQCEELIKGILEILEETKE